MPPFNPEAEKEYFSRGIARGDYTPFNGLFFNDPANDRSKRTWYDEYGRVVPGFGTGGPDGPYAGAGGGGAGSIEQIANDMALQRIAKTFNWTADKLPTIESFKGGGYWWSEDPHTFDLPQPRLQSIPQMIQGMTQQRQRPRRWWTETLDEARSQFAPSEPRPRFPNKPGRPDIMY